MRLPSISRSTGNSPAGLKRLSVNRSGFLSRSLCATALFGLAGLGLGCDSAMSPQNSFLDQSELVKADKGRDGLLVPILNHLNQQDKGVGAEFSRAVKVRAEDLVASSADYVIGKNDLLTISITDLVGPGIESVRQARVTESGKISMPLVPQVVAAGLTEDQLAQAIIAAYQDANLIQKAQVSVTVAEARARTFTIAGAIGGPGEYAIVRTDFRLLDALALAHDVTSTTGIDTLYIIRKSSQANPSSSNTTAPPTSVPTTNPGTDVLAPHSEAPAAPAHPMFMVTQDASAPASAPTDAGGMPAPGFMAGGAAAPTSPAPEAMPATAPGVTSGGSIDGKYVIIDGKPVLVDHAGMPTAGSTPTTADMPMASSGASDGSKDFEFNAPEEPTDTVILKIPIDALRRGELKYNVVIRPGDYIYVPQPIVGEYYMGGHVLRGGVYSLTARKITLKEAFLSAGGLDPVAIPGRTEIIRRVNDEQELFAIIDIEKIFAGSEPDVYLRPDDQILVGTNVVAPFIAAIRNGFRITYGFGFLYDRNFYTGK